MVRSDGLQVDRFQPQLAFRYPIGGGEVGYVQTAHSITNSEKEQIHFIFQIHQSGVIIETSPLPRAHPPKKVLEPRCSIELGSKPDANYCLDGRIITPDSYTYSVTHYTTIHWHHHQSQSQSKRFYKPLVLSQHSLRLIRVRGREKQEVLWVYGFDISMIFISNNLITTKRQQPIVLQSL